MAEDKKHNHEAENVGRVFAETCACGAIRFVGQNTWSVPED
ncbi:MAG: hypothetical protein V3U45_02310 [bacterium]